MSQKVCKTDQIRLITGCRKSELSNYQWCVPNDIYPRNFYNWVSKLRKNGYTFPESKALPNIQEIVKVELVPYPASKSGQMTGQNVSLPVNNLSVGAKLLIGDVTLRFF